MSSSNQSVGFELWLKENPNIMYAAAFMTLLIMCIGIVGNSLTILVILKSPRIRNVASTFIISLGAADLLFCITVLPFNASRFLNINWVQYPQLCSIVPFLQYGNIGVSLLFITMITINSSEKRMQRHQTSTQSDPTATHMQSIRRKLSEWRITKMVLAIFLSFVLCYLPITITKTLDPSVQYPAVLLIAYIMIYASACFNPIIYVIMNKQYRKAFKSVLNFGCCEKATKRVPVLRSISKRLQPHGIQEDRGFGTTVSHVSSIALESLDCNNRISRIA
ncbi:G-protein coupled receptor moody isoform X2 [Melanaphis sacchari]|uniref:G-protein coupled receptor moody isoform X2 n=1 Tax=Melanaphis sacchari TaxID=742174 RepID=UPI000DC12E3E|nr:G-protein coupled receptor moody isoform X2 [Melanaphis sacchari]